MKVSILKVCFSLVYVCIIVSQCTLQKKNIYELPSWLIANINCAFILLFHNLYITQYNFWMPISDTSIILLIE
jgi:hypothetical protein